MGLVKMGKNNKETESDVARRAWNVLRLALLWARKGGVFKRRLMTDLRLFPKFVIRSLGHVTSDGDDARHRYRYGERQMSFDETPVFPAVKFNGSSSSSSNRFLHIPCLNPPAVDFDYEFDLDDDENGVACACPRKSFLSIKDESDDQDQEENNIDSRAEEFIATFYEQIKMQRQISYLEYN